MKKMLLLLFSGLLVIGARAQIQSNSPKEESVKMQVGRITRDYYNNFSHIIGDTLDSYGSTIEFQCKVIPLGASQSTIMEIKGLKNVYSWQATLLQTDDFEKAVDAYHKLYRQLNGADYPIFAKEKWRFNGDYDNPDESRAFASSILQPVAPTPQLQRLKIEIALNYTMPEWTVKLMVYEKESDADMRPTYSSQGTY